MSCARTRKEVVSDRAKRYRANQPGCLPAGPKRCKLCGARDQLMVDHKNGDESDGRRVNLRWLCRPCNVREGAKMARAGKGRRTVQYNPVEFRKGDLVRWRGRGEQLYKVNRVMQSELRIESVEYPGVFHMVSRASLDLVRKKRNPTKAGGAANLYEYVLAGTRHTRGAHDEGGKTIHLTPKAKRREYAAQIWAKRSAGESARGRGYSDEPDWVSNPNKWTPAKLNGVPVRVRAVGKSIQIDLGKKAKR